MKDCKEWSFIEYVKNSEPACSFELASGTDNQTISDVLSESLAIAAAPINVFKLLGIHEQGQLLDLTGRGVAISAGDGNAHPAFNAFNKLCGEWRSKQKGSDVTKLAFIGYDFGPIVDDSTNVTYYGVETYKHVHIATIKLQQGANRANRAKRIRIERSQDGLTWFGVQIITLEDSAALQTIHFRGSAASRFWRLRPVEFNGGANDWWAVARLEMHDYEQTALTNIQNDSGFIELRDRDYAEVSTQIKMYYDLSDTQTDLTPFGPELDLQQMFLTVSFRDSVKLLGRPIVIGDILEIPSEIQYGPTLTPVKRYMEVTDVTWSTEGYTPGWQPTLQRLTAAPMLASQETLDIIPRTSTPDVTGFLDIDITNVEDYTEMNARVRAAADANVPERGSDAHAVHYFTDDEVAEAKELGLDVQKLNISQRSLYVEDGLPPNNAPYTEGPEYPKNPRDGAWHRLTYTATDSRIPARLYKYSGSKMRWIYYETDRRDQYNVLKPTIQDLIASPTKIPNSKVRK